MQSYLFQLFELVNLNREIKKLSAYFNLENLGEALLDFQSVEDLEQWLENERF